MQRGWRAVPVRVRLGRLPMRSLLPNCGVCGEPAWGVCCDVLMADLDEDGDTVVRGSD